jgi:hypothetical protein
MAINGSQQARSCTYSGFVVRPVSARNAVGSSSSRAGTIPRSQTSAFRPTTTQMYAAIARTRRSAENRVASASASKSWTRARTDHSDSDSIATYSRNSSLNGVAKPNRRPVQCRGPSRSSRPVQSERREPPT